MSTPPTAGKTISVKVDQQTCDVLAAMTATGMTVSDAVRSALLMIGGTYLKVWDHTVYPYGVRPTIASWFIDGYDPDQPPARGSVQTTVPTAYRAHPTPERTDVTARPTITPPDATARPTRPTPVRRSV